ncbi:MAG: hypothetical protein MZW92_45460 [Comamonadaceae bacterium]|nr:hypothetical protein [Comamonadaceae bacterium]
MAVVGAGWAGLAAAVRAARGRAHRSRCSRWRAHLGGRARGVDARRPSALDNGQHILIGAYRAHAGADARVGADPDAVLLRACRWSCATPDGRGLRLPPGAPWPAFVRARAGAPRLDAGATRLRCCARPPAGRCAASAARPSSTVDAAVPPACRRAVRADADRPAVRGGAEHAGARGQRRASSCACCATRCSAAAARADLLLPRAPLVDAAARAGRGAGCGSAGAELRLGHRVQRLAARRRAAGDVDGEALRRRRAGLQRRRGGAAGRRRSAPAWARAGRARCATSRSSPSTCDAPARALPAPMTALAEAPTAPAQFAFDHGALGRRRRAALPSWSAARGAGSTRAGRHARDAVLQPGAGAPSRRHLAEPPTLLRVLAEKRATFRCTPELARRRLRDRAGPARPRATTSTAPTRPRSKVRSASARHAVGGAAGRPDAGRARTRRPHRLAVGPRLPTACRFRHARRLPRCRISEPASRTVAS